MPYIQDTINNFNEARDYIVARTDNYLDPITEAKAYNEQTAEVEGTMRDTIREWGIAKGDAFDGPAPLWMAFMEVLNAYADFHRGLGWAAGDRANARA